MNMSRAWHVSDTHFSALSSVPHDPFFPVLPFCLVHPQNNRLSGDIAHSLATIYPDGNALMTIRRNYGGVAEGCVPPEKEVRKRVYYVQLQL